MQRSFERERLEGPGVPDAVSARFHRDLTRIHCMLGDLRTIISTDRRGPLPVRRMLDVGCGHGGVASEIQRRLGLEVVRVDLNPQRAAAPIGIVRADAVRDALPSADIAYSICVAHHLRDHELAALIRNVGRSSQRFILIDLVRHRLPLALFRLFVAPLISELAAADGCLSIRRPYTPPGFRGVVATALRGTDAVFSHCVAPLYIRQIAEIRYSSLGVMIESNTPATSATSIADGGSSSCPNSSPASWAARCESPLLNGSRSATA